MANGKFVFVPGHSRFACSARRCRQQRAIGNHAKGVRAIHRRTRYQERPGDHRPCQFADRPGRRSPSPISASSTLLRMAFLPNDQGLLVTEKAGRAQAAPADGKVVDIAGVPKCDGGRAACSMFIAALTYVDATSSI